MSVGNLKNKKKPTTIANLYHRVQSRNLCLKDNLTGMI